MDLLKVWREAKWEEVRPEVYREACNKFGCSVLTHPDFIEAVSAITEMPLRYLAQYEESCLIGAIPVWGKYLAGSKAPLRKAGKGRVIDTGNAEVILPLSPHHQFNLRFKGQFLSQLHKDGVSNIKPMGQTYISLARSHQPNQQDSLSKKFKYNQRRELRLFEESGGYYRSAADLSAAEFSNIYTSLFFRRWGFNIKGHEYFKTFVEKVRPLQTGFVLFSKHDQPVAVQWVLKVESSKWISCEYINGGVDPEYSNYSPGSILSYIHTKTLEEEAIKKEKELRFSFGKSDRSYKDRWCSRVPVYAI
ncbi:GNAT family N-acetyltransferase [Endozoicomonadaceae bacterium StTr2]